MYDTPSITEMLSCAHYKKNNKLVQAELLGGPQALICFTYELYFLWFLCLIAAFSAERI